MEVELFTEDFERITRQLDAAYDQLPFALMLALNDALFETKQVLTDVTWPKAVTVRNATFLDYALHVEKATKDDLSGAIVDQSDGHVHLKLHADSGTKHPRGANFAIPSKAVDLGAGGAIYKSERPRSLRNSVRIGNRIYQYQGRGKKNRKLVLMYTLKPSVNIKADVPFRQDFADAMKESAERHFVPRMMQAMRTR